MAFVQNIRVGWSPGHIEAVIAKGDSRAASYFALRKSASNFKARSATSLAAKPGHSRQMADIFRATHSGHTVPRSISFDTRNIDQSHEEYCLKNYLFQSY
jgi:hypothetical protein